MGLRVHGSRFKVSSLRFSLIVLISAVLNACKAGGTLTLLGLISSTLHHFGKASGLALHSASATPGIASELALLSLCAMVMVHGSRFKVHGSRFMVQGSRFKGQDSRLTHFL